ncbi:Electrogenic sodium bicarbonate cotransporter 1 [Fukomys damarensis]|uniref:Electrogenic sodium bicarbonate cotransporter 1 n=1 Tax=Fukomys damarensis TaxID=885580 RepID=A0A091CY21_FUKDA|nr:Electrogenic sodium bicarbonate cotransporter 1 [Fukomys damarensis]
MMPSLPRLISGSFDSPASGCLLRSRMKSLCQMWKASMTQVLIFETEKNQAPTLRAVSLFILGAAHQIAKRALWMEDEAVLDRGASFLKHVCDEEEVEGHHTIYIGVHVPKSYRRRRRHKRKTGHKEKKEKERISENYSDKSDVENADESSSSILKPLNALSATKMGKKEPKPSQYSTVQLSSVQFS